MTAIDTDQIDTTGKDVSDAFEPDNCDRRRMLARMNFQTFAALAGYAPHHSQRAIHESNARFRLSVCGRRFGKSMLASYEAAFHALLPDSRVWIVAPYRELATRVFNRTRDVLLYRLRLKPDSDRGGDLTLKFPWGAEVVGKTAENPDSLLGEGLDFVVLDEAPRMRDGVFARFILPSLADRRGRALIIGSPSGRGWVYRLATDAVCDTDWCVFNFASGANPYLSAGELALHRRLLSDLDFRREYLAEWVADSALVYPMFDATKHIAGCTYNPALPLFAGVDFGFTNPSCVLFAQLTPGESLNILGEVYARGLTANELATAITARAREIVEKSNGDTDMAGLNALASHSYIHRNSPHKPSLSNAIAVYPETLLRSNEGLPPLVAFCDPAGAGERAVLERYGIATLASRAGVMEGIARIRALLAPCDDSIATRIAIHPSCRNLVREFATYAYDEKGGTGGFTVAERGAGLLGERDYTGGEPKVVKRDDHALDALRYLVTGLGV